MTIPDNVVKFIQNEQDKWCHTPKEFSNTTVKSFNRGKEGDSQPNKETDMT